MVERFLSIVGFCEMVALILSATCHLRKNQNPSIFGLSYHLLRCEADGVVGRVVVDICTWGSEVFKIPREMTSRLLVPCLKVQGSFPDQPCKSGILIVEG